MKVDLRFIVFIFLGLTLILNSCKEEEFEFVGTPPEQGLRANSNVANLLLKVATNDGSIDNIIDNASCFSVELPVSLIVNGSELIVANKEDYETLEEILEESDDDDEDEEEEEEEDSLEIVFPITIILADFTKEIVTSSEELESYAANCAGENEEDDDIECVDFLYPITISTFNTNSETFDTIVLQDDKELYEFLDDLDDNEVVDIEFPVTLLFTDNTEQQIADLEQLENVIEDVKDSCEEDDDNDFDDDDCDDCSVQQLEEVLAGCSDWRVNKFSRDGENLKSMYDNLSFAFQEDGVISASSETETFLGTWMTNGVENNIEVLIDIPSLEDFNLTWILNRILETPGVNKVTLHEGDDVLRFQETCTDANPSGNGNPLSDASTVLIDGLWLVDTFLDDDTDRTADFNGFSLDFNIDGTVIADNGTPINGTWNIENGNTRLIFDYGTSVPFDQLNLDWKIDSLSDTRIELREVGAGNNGDILILTKL